MQRSHLPPALTHAQAPLLSPSPTRGMKLHCHITITQSPSFTGTFTPGDVQVMGLDKCIMTWIHHYGVIQSSFTTLKICFHFFFFFYHALKIIFELLSFESVPQTRHMGSSKPCPRSLERKRTTGDGQGG